MMLSNLPHIHAVDYPCICISAVRRSPVWLWLNRVSTGAKNAVPCFKNYTAPIVATVCAIGLFALGLYAFWQYFDVRQKIINLLKEVLPSMENNTHIHGGSVIVRTSTCDQVIVDGVPVGTRAF